jgi:outer membrane protein insertion porin family
VKVSGPAFERITHSRSGPRNHACLVATLLFLLFSPSLTAQQAQPPPYARFEGRNVSRATISASPQMDVAPFEKLIKQKAGSPFSLSDIAESVRALQATKLFSQVEVSVTPELSGLRVLFLLRPAYFVGLIAFPGATHRFPYAELLEAANVPQQSAFTESLLTQGESALLQFFRTQGYFLAAVHPRSQTDDVHRIVNLTFQVTLHEPARIGTIELQGIPEAEANWIRHGLRSRWMRLKREALVPGQKYSSTRVSKSVDYIRARLRSQGRLAPMVRMASQSFRADSNCVDLNYQIDLGPFLSVRVAGAHVSGRTLRRLIPIYEEGSIDQDLLAEGERNLKSYLQTKGYFDPKIESQVERQQDKVTVLYKVDRGRRYKVEAITFEGNQYFSSAKLESVMAVKKGHFLSRGTFSSDLDRKSSDAILALYKNQGFADAQVETRIEFDPRVDVIFLITEGPQDRVNSVKVVGNRTESLTSLLGKRPLREQPGKPYSPLDVRTDRNDILAAYLNRGYLTASFQSAATPVDGNTHLVNLVYQIAEGPRTTISNIVLLGDEHANPGFIQHMTAASIKTSQPLSTGKLLTAESDLYNLNIFDWASIRPAQPITDQTESQVLEEVHEEPRNMIDYGGGLEVIPRSGNIPVGEVVLPGLPPIGLGSKFTTSQKSFLGPRGTFDYTRRDIFGRAETFSASTILSRLDQNIDLSFSNPHFRDSSWSSAVSLSGQRTTENPLFAAELGTASLQFQKALDAKKTQNVIFRYDFDRTILSHITIPGLVLPQDRHVRLSTFAGVYTRDTRDDPLDARRGMYQVFNFGVTSTPLGSSANFVRFLGQSAFYLPVRSWLVWANNFRLGFAIPFLGSRVPLSESFFSGGADSLRGFPINGAGPQRPVEVCSNPALALTCTLISVPVGGEALFIFNSEARFQISNHWSKKLGGVFFYDGGNVYAHVNVPQMVDHYTNTIGLGLRYFTPVGPIRVDIGHNLNPAQGVNATQYFVTLGQMF